MNESRHPCDRLEGQRGRGALAASFPERHRWNGHLVLAILLVALTSCAHGMHPSDPTCYIPNVWPVEHPHRTVTSEFGNREDPYTHKQRFHKGIDIAAPMKTPVTATAYGRVEDRGSKGDGYGKYVLLDHGNGYETFYAHLSSIEVKKGKRVKRGQVIGKVGRSGRATGPHVQYEVRRGGKPEDPRGFLP